MLAPAVDIDLDAEAAGCRRLWCAVLATALRDAFATVTTHASGTSATERDEARKFLFSQRGQWAEARRQCCSLAGIDPDAFVESLKSKPPPDGDPMAAQGKRATSGRSLPTANESPSARGVRK
jgi:hypothetical protein